MHDKDAYFGIVGWQNVDVFFGVDWRLEDEQFVFNVDPEHGSVVDHGCVERESDVEFCLEDW